jgi:epsilon-lactone hydrolase
MTSRRRLLQHILVFGLSLPLTLGVLSSGAAQDKDNPVKIDPDGTVHVHELTIPPSNLWSPEMTRAFTDTLVSGPQSPVARMPARTAPKAVWDQFDAAYNGFLTDVLVRERKRFAVDVVDTTMAGVHVGVITPQKGVPAENAHRVLINLHGGGFILGRGLVSGELESIPVAALGQIKVITVDYRQAPYARYPAASEDVEAVYREALAQYKPAAIGIYGCSAGGSLTAQSVAWFQAKGLPRPGAVGILCAAPPIAPFPWGKFGDSTLWGNGGVPAVRPAATSAPAVSSDNPNHWYVGEDVDVHDPQAYPGSSDAVLSKFPSTLLLSGTRSYDMGPAVVAHARFLRLGVDSSLYIIEGGWHGAVVGAATPESYDANLYIARWFDQHLAH